jgi:heptosyltransferase-2
VRALLINTAFLGDVIFCAPLVENLVRAGYVVDAVTRPGYGALLLLNGEAITYDKRGQDRGIKALLRLGRALRGRYELVLGAHPSVRSGLLAALIKAPRSFGWGPLGYRVRVPRGARFVEDAIALGVAAGVPEGASRPQIAAVPARLAPGTIALVPGSRVATKRWPHWAALAPALAAQGHPLVWLGGAEEAPLAVGPGERAFGRSLQETASILKGCSIAVGGDSGLLHLARAVGTPVVMLFGPTPAERLPLDPGRLDLAIDLPCRPCSPHGPPRCPHGHHRCLVDLAPDRVRSGIQAGLQSSE